MRCFAAAFFPVGGQNLVFGLYLLGIGFAVVTGLILKSTLLKGEITPFVMELPPYHRPTAKGVLLSAWDRLKTFIFRAGKVHHPGGGGIEFSERHRDRRLLRQRR